ncbi:MAG: sensor histidine kinase, partial [Pseudomonadota bacterium]
RQLARALGHLLDNAIKGTPTDGQILIEIPKPGPEDEWSAAIVISDNGTGMSADTLAQALGGVSKGGEGSGEARIGLGLPLARQLIESHGGTLELTSEEGVGTTAIIVLP